MVAAEGTTSDEAAIRAVLAGQNPAGLAPATRDKIEDYAARIAGAPRETDALLAALDGGYVAPGPMQDAIRNPDALPGGRNPYTLDPRAAQPHEPHRMDAAPSGCPCGSR